MFESAKAMNNFPRPRQVRRIHQIPSQFQRKIRLAGGVQFRRPAGINAPAAVRQLPRTHVIRQLGDALRRSLAQNKEVINVVRFERGIGLHLLPLSPIRAWYRLPALPANSRVHPAATPGAQRRAQSRAPAAKRNSALATAPAPEQRVVLRPTLQKMPSLAPPESPAHAVQLFRPIIARGGPQRKAKLQCKYCVHLHFRAERRRKKHSNTSTIKLSPSSRLRSTIKMPLAYFVSHEFVLCGNPAAALTVATNPDRMQARKPGDRRVGHTSTPGGASSARFTRTSRGLGNGSPSRGFTEGFSRKSFAGNFIHGGSLPAAIAWPRSTSASARSSAARAESLKSSLAGSSTAKNSVGLTNCISELLSMTTAKGLSGCSPAFATFASSASLNAPRSNGNPSARNPCLVRNQNDRCAPAAKKRELSVPVSADCSQLISQMCSSGAQSQSCPFCAHTPCPYCVILPAIHHASGNAAMMSHTNCVFPIVRVCPPTTISRQQSLSRIIRNSASRLRSPKTRWFASPACISPLVTRHFFRQKQFSLPPHAIVSRLSDLFFSACLWQLCVSALSFWTSPRRDSQLSHPSSTGR